MTRQGDWMQTFTGQAFWPLDPQPDHVHPVDIAHALSMICRYGGHAQRYYSVAEHCVLLSHEVSPENALWALLHDAAEAYVGDMVRPLKHQPQMRAYRAAEVGVLWAVCRRFGLNWRECPAEVKDADLRIMVDERAALMATSLLPWTSLAGVQPLGVRITGWTPEVAKTQYLNRLAELTSGVRS